MARLLIFKYVGLLIMMLTVAWLAREPDWEPAVTLVGILTAFIAGEWSIYRKVRSNIQRQKELYDGNSIDVQPDTVEWIAKELAETEQMQTKHTEASLQQINRELRERAELEKLRAEHAKASYQYVGEDVKNRWGYEVGEMEVQVVIRDLEGTCHIRWIYRNIKKARPDIILSHIPGKLFFSPPESSFTKWPTLSFKDQTKYEIEFLRQDRNICEFEVKVNNLADNTISYEYTADANKAFYMSEEELAGQLYPYEWFGIGATISAIERLIVKVYFPKGYHVGSIHPDACIGWRASEFSDRAEVDRITNGVGFKRGEYEASLVVERPKFGYIYFLRWKPLPTALIKLISLNKD